MIAPQASAAFVAAMEQVLDIYSRPYVRIPVNVTADSGNVTGIPANVTGGRCCAF